jgi:hypothetical protein
VNAMRHTIRINMISSGRYAVTGAVSIPPTPTPIIDAALALKQAGADDSDLLSVVCGTCTVSDMTLGAITRPRHTAHRQRHLREMLGLDPR